MCTALAALFCALSQAAAAAAAEPPLVTALRADRTVDPLGIDDPAPSLGWQLRSERRGTAQSAYRVQVAASSEQLQTGPYLWDSGRVESAESVEVPYEGPVPAPGQRHVWRVMVWDELNQASGWSAAASWETALSDGDWHGAEWIAPAAATAATGWTDYTIDVELSVAAGAGGVAFRVQGPGDFYMWQVHVAGESVLLRPHVQQGGEWDLLDEVDVSGVIPPHAKHDPHQLRIVLDGETIVTEIDGVEVDWRQDATFASGGIGFRSGDASEDASFARLKITDSDGDPLFADEFEVAPDPAFPGAEIEAGKLRVRQGETTLIDSGPPAPLLRREFSLERPLAEVASARLYAYGLGFYELNLSGQRVGDRVLTPPATSYEWRLRYQTYDVRALLREGQNALGVTLAEGYGPAFSAHGWRWLGPRQALILLDVAYEDGSRQRLASDGSWRWSEGPVREATIYGGETYDARLERDGWDEPGFDDAAWEQVRTVPAPPGELEADTTPPLRVTETLEPVAVGEPEPGVYVFDLGQNIAGWARLRTQGPAGTEVRLRYAEDVDAEGGIDAFTNRNAEATDTFVLAGGGEVETFEPSFTYHGFRYVEVSGLPEPPDAATIVGRAVHADRAVTATFESSSPLLNRIYANNRWTMANNAMSYPTDTPTRDERTGPPMDVHAYGDAAVRDFDSARFFAAYLEELGGGWGGSPDMRAANVPLAWSLYEQYGDSEVLTGAYEGMAKAVDDYAEEAEGYVWPVAEPGADGFGDWCPPLPAAAVGGGVGSPEIDGYLECFSEISLVNTALGYRNATIAAAAARALGLEQDAVRYDGIAAAIAAAFEAEFEVPGGYGSRRQVTSVLPLAFGMVPPERREEVAAGLVQRVLEVDGGHLDTGIFGTRFLVEALVAAGRPDVALTVLEQTGYPGYGYQIGLGATTAWEAWTYRSGMETHDHAMFAGINASLLTELGGIEPAAPGYAEVRIAPVLPDGLDDVAASLDTVRGRVGSSWERTAEGLRLEAVVPANSVAEVHVPLGVGEEVLEGGLAAACAAGVDFRREEDGAAVFAVASGSYEFETRPRAGPEPDCSGTGSGEESGDDGSGGSGGGEQPRRDEPVPPAAAPDRRPAATAPTRTRLALGARLLARGRIVLRIACRAGCPSSPSRLRVTVASPARPGRVLATATAWLRRDRARLRLRPFAGSLPRRLRVTVRGFDHGAVAATVALRRARSDPRGS